MNLQQLHAGQRIHISGPPGRCPGTVIHVGTPAELPQIPGAPSAASVAAILAEGGVQQIAFVEWLHGGEPTCCAIFGDGRSRWWDLQRQQLSIEAACT